MGKQIIIFARRMLFALFGLSICAFGVVTMINAGIGRAPWDVFYQGLAMQTGITFGQAWISFSVVILIVLLLLKEPVGFGTLLDMFVCGQIADGLLALDFLPKGKGIISGLIIMIVGFFVFAVGCLFYMRARLGVGPRDILMIVFVKRLYIPIGVSKTILDGLACFFGWLMGGDVGVGTIAAAVGIGIAIQIVFYFAKFDVKTVRQENFKETILNIKGGYDRTLEIKEDTFVNE